MKIYPYYPKPIKNKATQFLRYFINKRSWLDGLYGRSYTMKMGEFTMPKVTLYIPNEPELVHRIMVSDVKHFPKHTLLHEMLKPLLGESIFTTNGNIWKKQREMLNPSFEMVRITHVFNLMNDAAKDLMERISILDKDLYHNIDTEMTFVTADIIFRTILSKTLSLEEGEKVLNAFVEFQEASAKIATQDMFKIPNILRRGKVRETYISSGKVIRDSLANIIKPRYDSMLNNEVDENKDILSSLLKAIDEDTKKPFSFKEILDQVAMLFLAGHETTASSMTWTLYLLALYPSTQEKAYQEVVDTCGDDEFTAQNTKQLELISKIFKESLRLYPPVSFFARETDKETTMRGKTLKKGAVVIVSPWLMHRNEIYWKDPHMFDPHRFDDPKKIVKNTYFPFGLGQRICIGAGFAMQESTLLLASILREYKLELEDGFVPDVVGRLTTRSLNGMNIKLIKRER